MALYILRSNVNQVNSFSLATPVHGRGLIFAHEPVSHQSSLTGVTFALTMPLSYAVDSVGASVNSNSSVPPRPTKR